MPFKDFAAGEILTAADVDDYLMRQAVMTFDDSTARGTAIGTAVITEGMVTYLKDTDALEFWNGASWQGVSNPGDITAVTAGTALTGGGISGDVTLNVDVDTLAGTALVSSGTALDVNIAAVGSAVTINNTQVVRTITNDASTSYSVVSGDANTILRFTNSSAGTVTFGTATAFGIGEAVDILMDGAGTVIIASSGVNVYGRGTAGTTYNIGQRYDAVSVLCVAADEYRIIGNAEAV